MKKQDIKKRLQGLLRLLQSNQGYTKEELSEELGISAATLGRDLKSLKSQMHVIRCNDGKYYYEKRLDNSLKHKKYSTTQHKAFKILLEIEKHPGSTEASLRTHFIKRRKEDDTNAGSMCEKTFNKYINELLKQGLIAAGPPKSGQRTFTIADINQAETLSVEVCVKMIQFIRANLGPLPFDSQLKSITDKLENAILHSLSGSALAYLGNEEQMKEDQSEVYQNVGLSYKLFSNLDYDVEKQQANMLDNLQQACDNLSFAEIHLKGSKKPIRHYCLFIMCHILLNRWYLVIKTPKVNRGFGLIRVDKIAKVSFPQDIHTSEGMLESIKKAKEDAMREIVDSYGMGLGDKLQIKLLLSSDQEVTENALAWLDAFIVPDSRSLREDGTSIVTVEIDGVSDFMHWLRGYGSHILVLEPEYLRNFQLDEMEQLIRKYQEVRL